MNIREITENYPETLETLEKIYKEYEFEPVGSELNNLNEYIKERKVDGDKFKFYSAFENGAEIAVLVVCSNEICVLAIKKYARTRGVGQKLLEYYLNTLKKGSVVKVKIEPEFISFFNKFGFRTISKEQTTESGKGFVEMEYRK